MRSVVRGRKPRRADSESLRIRIFDLPAGLIRGSQAQVATDTARSPGPGARAPTVLTRKTILTLEITLRQLAQANAAICAIAALKPNCPKLP
jgi:hypothetical protein